MSEPRKVTIVREEWYPVFNVQAPPGPGRPRVLVVELTAAETARYEACLEEFDAVQAMLRSKLVAAENPSPSSPRRPALPAPSADPLPS